jgi:hypothetical protein
MRAMSRFKDAAELRNVFDRLFTMLSEDPDVGPRLKAKDTRQRYLFTDMGVTLDVAPSDAKRTAAGRSLKWVWDKKKLDWEPDVVLEMASDVANRYFQGRENVPLAIARKSIVVRSGDVIKVLDLLPIVLPFHTKWVARLKSDGLTHLLV